MKLEKFSCYLTNETDYKDEWILEDIYLNDLNLLVGKNSTGKSRAIRAIKLFAKVIISSQLVRAHFKFHFQSDQGVLIYEIKINSTSVFERITLNDNIHLLEREGNTAKIYSYTERRIQTIHPPERVLTLHTRRDINEYPFFEDLVFWAETVQVFNFGHVHASVSFDNESLEREKTVSSDKTIGEMVDDLTIEGKSFIIRTFNELGYELEDVIPNLNKSKKEIIIKERYLNEGLLETSISQGMFRSLFLLIFIQFKLEENRLKTLIIDDLCEGLDYERSSILGKKVFEILKLHKVQTIATTNDYFLMNAIDVDSWNILRRKKNIVRSYNKSTYPELFKKFDFSGLINFDLFSSDFIEKEAGHE